MKFENEELNVTFEVPDNPSVRQQMAYMGTVSGTPDGMFLLRWWNGARSLITEWDCEIFPDKEGDLDKVTDPKISEILTWAGLKVQGHMSNLGEVEKNS